MAEDSFERFYSATYERLLRQLALVTGPSWRWPGTAAGSVADGRGLAEGTSPVAAV